MSINRERIRSLGETDLVPHEVSHDKRAKLLDESQWCQEFKWRELQTLSDFLYVLEAQPGDLIFHEHAKEVYLCLVVSGSINILKNHGQGNETLLGTIADGKVLGEMALLDRHPRSASAVAKSKTLVMVMTPAQLARMVKVRPRLATKFIWKLAKSLSERLRSTSGKLVNQ